MATWSCITQSKAILTMLSSLKKPFSRILFFSDFNGHTYGLFFDFKIVEYWKFSKLQKLFSYLILETMTSLMDLNRRFKLNATIQYYETRFPKIFYLPKARTSKFGIITSTYNSAKTLNHFTFFIIFIELNLTKSKLKKLLETHFLK